MQKKKKKNSKFTVSYLHRLLLNSSLGNICTACQIMLKWQLSIRKKIKVVWNHYQAFCMVFCSNTWFPTHSAELSFSVNCAMKEHSTLLLKILWSLDIQILFHTGGLEQIPLRNNLYWNPTEWPLWSHLTHNLRVFLQSLDNFKQTIIKGFGFLCEL